MNTKRGDSDAFDASDASKKPIISSTSGWCVSPFTPATGVQILVAALVTAKMYSALID